MKLLRNALVEIANEDTESGVGLRDLTAQVWPLKDETHLGDASTPQAVIAAMDEVEGSMSGRFNIEVQFSIFGHSTDDDRLDSDGLSYIERVEDIRERLIARVTHARLLAKGVDAAPLNPVKGDLPDDGDGTKGLFLRLRFANAK